MKMKKNLVFRLGLLALVLTLVTMPLVSGTYAKYVTSETGTAQARVAKWGVTVEVDDTKVFGEEYDEGKYNIHEDASQAAVSVKSNSNDFVLAPGTEGSMTFKISGTPEVSYEVSFTDTEANPGANFIVFSDDWDYNPQNTGTPYLPVKFSLTDNNGETSELNKTADEMNDILADLDEDAIVLDQEYTLTWRWAFEGQDDAGDTYYGNYAATNYDAQNPVLTLTFDLKITVSQID